MKDVDGFQYINLLLETLLSVTGWNYFAGYSQLKKMYFKKQVSALNAV